MDKRAFVIDMLSLYRANGDKEKFVEIKSGLSKLSTSLLIHFLNDEQVDELKKKFPNI